METVKSAIRYFEAADLPVMVRVPSQDYHFLARAMDMGAEGLMAPMVGTVEQAQHIINSMKYHPAGARGVALQIAHDRYRPGSVADKFAAANQRSAFFCLIETADGVKNIDGIAALDGVDCLWVGHFDLSVSLGIPGDFAHPTFTGAMDKIVAAAKKHNKSLGRLVPNVQQGHRLLRAGLRFHLLFGRRLGAARRDGRRGLEDPRRVQVEAEETMADAKFRVALSGDFRKPDGSPTYPDFDLEPLRDAPGVEMAFLESSNPLRAEQLEDFDALILLAHRFDAASVPKSGRLAVVARFGVGYDTVDVEACTEAGIALVITPDGVRRPVAVSVITFMLALTGKLLTKDRADPRGGLTASPSAPIIWASASSGARWARSASAISAPRCSAWRSPST